MAENKNFENEDAILSEARLFGGRTLRGRSLAIESIRRDAKIIGENGDCPVLILGETGVGKETVAALIHGHSPRSDKPFVAVNCAVLEKNLFASQVFGHVKGAFTDAREDREGLLETAEGGTLFLDEITEMDPSAQAKLLRFLQEKRFSRLGDIKERDVDARIVAASNADIVRETREGRFRMDLFFRLNVARIHVPSLRERIEDAVIIAEGHLRNRNDRSFLSNSDKAAIARHDWPGNVRELLNVIDRWLVFGKRRPLWEIIEGERLFLADQFSDKPPSGPPFPPAKGSAPKNVSRESEILVEENLDAVIRMKIEQVLEKRGGNKTKAAKALGISVNTLKNRLRHH